ncbi:hypothetical protein L6164_011412 [Bauhinia variegata]|uniref:Uncharacterized protein n=1 Tax=Bauhinia variegata TaxID=167791 RepID=A0ACB9P6Q3_BAUVA|nr:hypothetical protein L6164_011412 [Bauhinia variegata]
MHLTNLSKSDNSYRFLVYICDSFGWNVPTNQNFYSEWASSKNFFVGDKLVFNWTGTHTVAIVSKDDYDNCNTAASPFGSNLNETSFMVGLSETGPHYFICTIGNHCASGQKLSINVESSISGGPAAQPPESSTSAPTLSHLGLLSAFVSTLAVYFFTRV